MGSVLVVGAHLDSVVAGPGINDNGSGSQRCWNSPARSGASPRRSPCASRSGEPRSWPDRLTELRAGPGPRRGHRLPQLRHARPRGGSAAVYEGRYADRMLSYFKRRGLPAETVDLTGRSDHFPFEQRGVPTGGLFAGVDRCYHSACDRLDGVNMKLLAQLASAAASASRRSHRCDRPLSRERRGNGARIDRREPCCAAVSPPAPPR